MSVTGSPNSEWFRFAIYRGGFKPGASPEMGRSEIEFDISLGSGQDKASIVGPKVYERAAHINFGAMGTNINQDGDVDDVFFDEDIESIGFQSAPGRSQDVVTGMGGEGTGSPVDRPLEITGSEGSNKLTGGLDNDTIVGGGDPDVIRGGPGEDKLGGKDFLIGVEDGRDLIKGGRGDDRIKGDGGDDRLFGGWGADRIEGNFEKDQLYGGGGSDKLEGNSRHDELFGGTGNDTLSGGAGSDVCSGGPGTDITTDCEG